MNFQAISGLFPNHFMRSSRVLVISSVVLLAACSRSDSQTDTVEASVAPAAGTGEPISALASDHPDLPEAFAQAREPWTGDFEGMVERRYLRALVTPNMMSYFLDGADQKGTAYELLKRLEEQINKDLGRGHLKVHILIMPTRRDRLLRDLVEGRGDLAASNLTITRGRQEEVRFPAPLATGISEIVVTGPAAPKLESLDDLAGHRVYVRRSSSYWPSLEQLNQQLRDRGRAEVILEAADERLETEDILEMVQAGLVPITVADSYLAEFWAQIHDQLQLHPKLALRTNGEIGWAIRKGSPQLEAVLKKFVKEHKAGTLMGNILIKRYLKSTQWVVNPTADKERERFDATISLFEKYGDQYALDFLLIAAQGYQESRLDQATRSPAGAIGVMQLLKSTASDPNVGIPDIEKLEPNVHAGVKYLRFLIDRYFMEEDIDPLDRTLLGFAAYNAGPSRVAGLRRKAAAADLDPNVWFDNVEIVAAREIGRETVQYVSNIYKYYVAYRLMMARERELEAAKS